MLSRIQLKTIVKSNEELAIENDTENVWHGQSLRVKEDELSK